MLFKRKQKTIKKFDDEFLNFVKNIKNEKNTNHPIVIDNLRTRASFEYFKRTVL